MYLSKLALEVSGGTTKTARRQGSRTMWQVLRDGLDSGLADDLEAWEQYAGREGRLLVAWLARMAARGTAGAAGEARHRAAALDTPHARWHHLA